MFKKDFVFLSKKLIKEIGINETYILTMMIEEIENSHLKFKNFTLISEEKLSSIAGLYLREILMVIKNLISMEIVELYKLDGNNFYKINYEVIENIINE